MSSKPIAQILIIDNDEVLARAITTRLENHGYGCVSARGGEEGLEAYSLGAYDLIITDINMPSLDGIGMIERIRLHSEVPIIAVTGFADQYRGKIRRYSRVTLLKKPFEAQALFDLVEIEFAQGGRRMAG